jgi:hypothetical protein
MKKIEDYKSTMSDIKNILSDEINMTRTYKLLINDSTAFPQSSQLNRFLSDHEQAKSYWSGQIQNKIIPQTPSDSDTIQNIKRIITGVAGSKIQKEAISELQRIEEESLAHYQTLLLSSQINSSQKSYIRSILLPKQEANLARIASLKNSATQDQKEKT